MLIHFSMTAARLVPFLRCRISHIIRPVICINRSMKTTAMVASKQDTYNWNQIRTGKTTISHQNTNFPNENHEKTQFPTWHSQCLKKKARCSSHACLVNCSLIMNWPPRKPSIFLGFTMLRVNPRYHKTYISKTNKLVLSTASPVVRWYACMHFFLSFFLSSHHIRFLWELGTSRPRREGKLACAFYEEK